MGEPTAEKIEWKSPRTIDGPITIPYALISYNSLQELLFFDVDKIIAVPIGYAEDQILDELNIPVIEGRYVANVVQEIIRVDDSNCIGGEGLEIRLTVIYSDQTEEVSSSEIGCKPVELSEMIAIMGCGNNGLRESGQEAKFGTDDDGDGEFEQIELIFSRCAIPQIVNQLQMMTPTVDVTPIDSGGSVCPNGGVLITTYIDGDGNGAMDSSEITDRSKVCNGSDGAESSEVLTVSRSASINECPNGGNTVTIGRDVDGNGVLDESEILNSLIACHTSSGPSSLIRFENTSDSLDCPGILVEMHTGFDDNGDGELQDGEVRRTESFCTQTSNNDEPIQVLHETIIPGVDCTNGGYSVVMWKDNDGNGELTPDEIINSTIHCNTSVETDPIQFDEEDGDGVVGNDDDHPNVDRRNDYDNDGVTNDQDICPDTEPGTIVSSDGCPDDE